MVSVIAPFAAVRLSPQVFVFGSCLLLVYHIKVADAFLVETSFVYARHLHASVAEGLELYHIYSSCTVEKVFRPVRLKILI